MTPDHDIPVVRHPRPTGVVRAIALAFAVGLALFTLAALAATL